MTRMGVAASKSLLESSPTLGGSSINIGTIQRSLTWPLRKDDTHKSRSVNDFERSPTSRHGGQRHVDHEARDERRRAGKGCACVCVCVRACANLVLTLISTLKYKSNNGIHNVNTVCVADFFRIGCKRGAGQGHTKKMSRTAQCEKSVKPCRAGGGAVNTNNKSYQLPHRRRGYPGTLQQ